MKPKPKPLPAQQQDADMPGLLIPELRLLVVSGHELRRNTPHLRLSDLDDTDEVSSIAIEWHRLH